MVDHLGGNQEVHRLQRRVATVETMRTGGGGGGDEDHLGDGDESLVLGIGAQAHGDQSVALGPFSDSYSLYSVAIGPAAQANGEESVAIGYAADAFHDQSVALGRNAATWEANQVVLGHFNARVVVGGTLYVEQRTPTGTADTTGYPGDVCWDDDYIYFRGSGGWKRVAGSTW